MPTSTSTPPTSPPSPHKFAQHLKSLSGVFLSRFALTAGGLLFVALLIWFAGPLFAFDNVRPLGTIGARLACIALLLVLAMLWLANGPTWLVGVVVSCLAIWYAGPLLSVGSGSGSQPLFSPVARGLFIGAVVLVCAVYGLYRLLNLIAENPKGLKRILSFGRADIEAEARRTALLPVTVRIERAVAQLRRLQSGGFWRRSFEKNRFLYALPWFLVIGGPGAGKTALLRQSGLQFPLTHDPASQAQAGSSASPGMPTQHCDWWIANDAVLIDTSGAYCAPQQGDEPADGAAPAPTEWRGLLGLLRKHRPRAPVNGVLLAVSVAELLAPDERERARHAGLLRERLAEIRRELGIRCPVYLVVTKIDLLRGFGAFFQSLTQEGRAQVWGFALDHELARKVAAPGPSSAAARPVRAGLKDLDAEREALRHLVAQEMSRLGTRLQGGLRMRLKEEFEVDRRRTLFALPAEMEALAGPLARTIDAIFLDSRFDDTQSHHTLRGVYFTSAEQQGGAEVAADTHTVFHQLAGISTGGTVPQGKTSGAGAAASPMRERQGFFLHALFTAVVFPGAHLVRPNLRWELRFRLLRMSSHALAAVVFVWLAASLTISWRNNRLYLEGVQQRSERLRADTLASLTQARDSQAPVLLDAARRLPAHEGLDRSGPPARFAYGLYTGQPVFAASDAVYARLQEITLLPTVLQRMETVLAASLRDHDAVRTYATLRAYRLLHDPARYLADGGAADVRAWVLADPETSQGPAASHVVSLFAGNRAVQAGTPADENLVREAQRFLDTETSSQRIYQRARAALLPDAPPDFTLVRAVGPQVGTVFSREGGLPVEAGVPGLFTREGYHGLVVGKLPAFVDRAASEDAWVMGRKDALAGPLLEDVRRQYLDEYTRHWTEFLESIRAVGSLAAAPSLAGAAPSLADGAAASLGLELSVLRQLAAPDSPLTRLARAVAWETTLSQSVAGAAALPGAPNALLDRLTGGASVANPPVGENGSPGSLADTARRQVIERVDKPFAALRELVTGRADSAPMSAANPFRVGQAAQSSGLALSPGPVPVAPAFPDGTSAGGRPGLEAVTALVNEYYTQLVVADTALLAGGLPPGGTDIGARLALEAGKLPPPLREVLLSLSRSGGEKVMLGAGGILRRQAQLQFDRMLGLLAQNVAEPCRRGIDGRYPFALSAQDAAIDDVTRIFAVGGATDEFFNRYLAPFVDTSVRPWRYRSSTTPSLTAMLDSLAAQAATSASAGTPAASFTQVAGFSPAASPASPSMLGELLKLLSRSGPDPETFYRAQQIRDLLFHENGGKRLQWRMELAVLELDPTITDLMIDIDGQGQRYMHGPVQALHVDWPGPRGGSMAALTANPRISSASSSVSVTGPWALLRLLDKGRVVSTASAGRVNVELAFDGRKALLGITTDSRANPLDNDVLRGFHCPGGAAPRGAPQPSGAAA
jgi:type VI secretion system protein ImpL